MHKNIKSLIVRVVFNATRMMMIMMMMSFYDMSILLILQSRQQLDYCYVCCSRPAATLRDYWHVYLYSSSLQYYITAVLVQVPTVSTVLQ